LKESYQILSNCKVNDGHGVYTPAHPVFIELDRFVKNVSDGHKGDQIQPWSDASRGKLRVLQL
jgi:hypothetical protein